MTSPWYSSSKDVIMTVDRQEIRGLQHQSLSSQNTFPSGYHEVWLFSSSDKSSIARLPTMYSGIGWNHLFNRIAYKIVPHEKNSRSVNLSGFLEFREAQPYAVVSKFFSGVFWQCHEGSVSNAYMNLKGNTSHDLSQQTSYCTIGDFSKLEKGLHDDQSLDYVFQPTRKVRKLANMPSPLQQSFVGTHDSTSFPSLSHYPTFENSDLLSMPLADLLGVPSTLNDPSVANTMSFGSLPYDPESPASMYDDAVASSSTPSFTPRPTDGNAIIKKVELYNPFEEVFDCVSTIPASSTQNSSDFEKSTQSSPHSSPPHSSSSACDDMPEGRVFVKTYVESTTCVDHNCVNDAIDAAKMSPSDVILIIDANSKSQVSSYIYGATNILDMSQKTYDNMIRGVNEMLSLVDWSNTVDSHGKVVSTAFAQIIKNHKALVTRYAPLVGKALDISKLPNVDVIPCCSIHTLREHRAKNLTTFSNFSQNLRNSSNIWLKRFVALRRSIFDYAKSLFVERSHEKFNLRVFIDCDFPTKSKFDDLATSALLASSELVIPVSSSDYPMLEKMIKDVIKKVFSKVNADSVRYKIVRSGGGGFFYLPVKIMLLLPKKKAFPQTCTKNLLDMIKTDSGLSRQDIILCYK